MKPRVHADENVVDHGFVLEHRQILERARDAEPRQPVGRKARDLPVLERDPACGRLEDPGDQVEHRGLAGAVRADQAEDLAAVDRKAHVGDGAQAAEPFRDALDAQDRAHDSQRLRRL